MADELKKLEDIAARFRKMTGKVKLIKLITKAKQEYDKYDYESGLSTLEEAIALEPDNPTILRGLGCIYQFRKEYEKALEYYSKALQNSKNKEIEYTLIGIIYYLQDKLDDAVENFNSAIDCNDDYEKAYEYRNQAMLENHLKIIDLQETLKKYF